MDAPITISIPIKNGIAGFLETIGLPGINILVIIRAGSHRNTPAHQAISAKPRTTSAINRPIAIIGTIIFATVEENQNGASKMLTPPGPGCLIYAPWTKPEPKQKIKYLTNMA